MATKKSEGKGHATRPAHTAQTKTQSTSTARQGDDVSTHGSRVVEVVRPKKLGRPRTQLEKPKVVPTRCPAHMYTYLKMIAPLRWRSLSAMFQDMMARFLEMEPWNHGLMWRKPRTALTFADGMAGKTGWEAVNMQLPPELAERVEHAATLAGVSKAAFCYTAMFWWVQFMYPPARVRQLSVG